MTNTATKHGTSSRREKRSAPPNTTSKEPLDFDLEKLGKLEAAHRRKHKLPVPVEKDGVLLYEMPDGRLLTPAQFKKRHQTPARSGKAGKAKAAACSTGGSPAEASIPMYGRGSKD
jgi:hypothetical protein